jgi:hypothetical protein
VSDRVARRILVASLLPGGLALTTLRPAAACSFGPATLNDLTPGTEFIFVAEVISAEDRIYVLEVSRVFRGTVPPSLTFEPKSAGTVSSCDANLEPNGTYLFGMNDFTGVLSLSDVWLEIDGQRLSGIRIETPDGGATALYDMLEQLPDTAALPRNESRVPPPWTAAGMLLLVAALAVAGRRCHQIAA